MATLESLKIDYIELRRDLKSFPKESVMYIKIKQKIDNFLKEVKNKHDQEMVEAITGKKTITPKKKGNPIPKKEENFIPIKCPLCENTTLIGAKRFRKHNKKQHGITSPSKTE